MTVEDLDGDHPARNGGSSDEEDAAAVAPTPPPPLRMRQDSAIFSKGEMRRKLGEAMKVRALRPRVCPLFVAIPEDLCRNFLAAALCTGSFSVLES